MDTQDEKRLELLQLSTSKLGDIARFCNRYPNIEVHGALEKFFLQPIQKIFRY